MPGPCSAVLPRDVLPASLAFHSSTTEPMRPCPLLVKHYLSAYLLSLTPTPGRCCSFQSPVLCSSAIKLLASVPAAACAHCCRLRSAALHAPAAQVARAQAYTNWLKLSVISPVRLVSVALNRRRTPSRKTHIGRNSPKCRQPLLRGRRGKGGKEVVCVCVGRGG